MTTLQVGGAIRPGSGYVTRAADDELFVALSSGELCYVLAPRQIGKSSLMVRTASRLREIGIRTAIVDLTALGTDVDPRSWYLGLADELASECGVEAPDRWFETEQPPVQQLTRFLGDAVLRSDARTVIFVDEIDATLSLDFSRDDFFGAIRALFNRRAAEPRWGALTFCLLGAASPWELASDVQRTPFNIGRDVRLRDFRREEVQGLEAAVDRPGWLDEVYDWTRGHPYMTQRLGSWLAERGGSVDEAVAACFLERGTRGDVTLASSERLILADRGRLLTLYRTALSSGSVVARPVEARAAVMTGLLSERADGALGVRNRVVARVFDAPWVEAAVGARPHRDAVTRWVAGGRADEDLARGQELTALRGWTEGREDLDADETAFALRSTQAAQRAESERARQRLVRVGLGSVAVIALVLAVALVGTGLALQSQRRATEQAQALRSAAETELMTQVPGRQLEALGAAVRGVRASRLPEAAVALTAAIDAAAGTRVSVGAPVRRVHCGEQVRAWTEGKAWTVSFEDGSVVPAMGDPPEIFVGPPDVRIRLVGGHDEPVLAWDLAGDRLVTGADDDSAVVWDVGTGRALAVHRLHTGSIVDVSICPDRQTAVLASGDGTVGLFRLLGGGVEQALPRSDITFARWTPKGEIATVSADGEVELWRGTGQRIRTIASGFSGEAMVRVSPEGTVVIVDSNHRARVLPTTGDPWEVHGWGSGAMPWFTAGNRMALLRWDAVALISLGAAGDPVVTSTPTSQLTWAEASADGRWLATAGFNGEVRLVDTAAPDGGVLLARREALVMGATWSATGLLASYDEGGGLVIWKPPEPEPVARLSAHRGAITHLAWSPDGQHLATAGFTDSTVKLWTADGGMVTQLGQQMRPRWVAFSPDSSRLATAGNDGRVRFWNGRTGASLGALGGHAGVVRALQYSPDGQRLLTLADDGWVRLFPATTEGLVDQACRWLALAGESCREAMLVPEVPIAEP